MLLFFILRINNQIYYSHTKRYQCMVNQQILPSYLVVGYLRAFIDRAIVLSMFMLSFIFVIVLKESVQVFFIICLYMYCRLRSSYQRRDPINRCNPATFVCLSQARTWISNIICSGLICVQ